MGSHEKKIKKEKKGSLVRKDTDTPLPFVLLMILLTLVT